jgi:hypothetical protein
MVDGHKRVEEVDGEGSRWMLAETGVAIMVERNWST